MTNKNALFISSTIAIATMIAFWLASFKMNIVLIFVPGVLLSYLVYLKTFYKKAPEPNHFLPIYLFALGIQLLHFAEEYIYDFTAKMPELLGEKEAYSTSYWVAFNMIAYFVFIIGGIALFKKHKSLLIIPIFFILVGVFLNSMGHIFLSIYTGDYFPGLYTSFIYIAMIPSLVKKIMRH
jgi:hypothetical protein